MKARILLATTLLTVALPAHAFEFRDPKTLDFTKAQQALGRGGPEVKALFTRSGNGLVLLGGSGVGYLTNYLYIGGAGYGGMGTNQVDGIGYGGFLTGYESQLGPVLTDISLLVGGGGGSVGAASGGSFAIEPNIAVKHALGGGAKIAVQASYLYFPGFSVASGPTVGLRLEFKNLSFSFPIDD